MAFKLDPSIKSCAETAVDAIMSEVKGARAVVVATEDGFEVAARVQNFAQTARLSAMASSFASLGALVGEESQLGECNKVIIDAEEGYILIMQIHNPKLALTMCVIASNESVMGQMFYFSKQIAQHLAVA